MKRCTGTSKEIGKLEGMAEKIRKLYLEIEKETHEQITLREEVHQREKEPSAKLPRSSREIDRMCKNHMVYLSETRRKRGFYRCRAPRYHVIS